jgi:hypothetical protein
VSPAGPEAMLDFPIDVYEEPLPGKVYGPSFKSPILFFLTDKGDPRGVLTAFALCDFARGRILYLMSCNPENGRRLQEGLTPEMERRLPVLPRRGFIQVHSAIEIVPGESFYAFAFGSLPCSIFYQVDYRRKRMRVVTTEDFRAISGSDPVESFGCTFARDPQDPRHFYLTAKLAPTDDRPPRIAYYRVSMDLREAQHLFSRPCPPQAECPHATRRFGDDLLSSEFNEMEYQLIKSGEVFSSDIAFHDHVIHRYWSGLGWGDRVRALGRHVLVHPLALARDLRRRRRAKRGCVRLADVAIARCFRGGHPSGEFVWACMASDDYRFRLAPGSIRVLSLTRAAETAFKVHHSKPAHFEIGPSGHVYLSCHTFFVWGVRTYFIEPAAILKLRVAGGTVEEKGAFRHPTGFRFTSHVVFQADGREWVCAMGQPNRLFLVDADTMELAAFCDIGPDHLSAQPDIGLYLSGHNLEPQAMRALAASDDGRYLAIGGAGRVDIVELPSLAGVDSLPVTASVCRLAGRAAGELTLEALHCARLG